MFVNDLAMLLLEKHPEVVHKKIELLSRATSSKARIGLTTPR